jgi:hypothetical protein
VLAYPHTIWSYEPRIRTFRTRTFRTFETFGF